MNAHDRERPVGPTASTAMRASRRRHLVSMALDLALPLGGYYLLRAWGWDTVGSYAAATAIGAARLVTKSARNRRLDGVPAFVLVAFGLQLAVSVLLHDVRAGIAADSLLSGVAGVVLIGSCLAGRPLLHYVMVRIAGAGPEQRARMADRWTQRPGWTATMRTLTLVCGLVLFGEALLRVVLVLALGPDTLVGLSHVLRLVTVGGLVLWTWQCAKRKLSQGSPRASGQTPSLGAEQQ